MSKQEELFVRNLSLLQFGRLHTLANFYVNLFRYLLLMERNP